MKKRSKNIRLLTGIIGLFIFPCCLLGCSKKTVDYISDDVVSDNSVSDNAVHEETFQRDGIGKRLGVPKSCYETLDIGTSGLESLYVNADDIDVPDTDKLYIQHFTIKTLDNHEKKRIAKLLFDKETDIYATDNAYATKSDIQLQIDACNEQLELARESASSSYIATLEQRLEDLKATQADAPDTYPIASDYSESDFCGTFHGMPYNLYIIDYAEQKEYNSLGIGVSFYCNVRNLELKPMEGAATSFVHENEDDNNVLPNKSDISAEQASNIAYDFLHNLGISDISLTDTKDLIWDYYDGANDFMSSEADGYAFYFTKAINKIPVYTGQAWNFVNSSLRDGWINLPEEKYYVEIYNGEVLSANWTQIADTTTITEEAATLLSYEEIIDKANTAIPKYYEENKAQYNSVGFNKLYLSYFIAPDENNAGKLKYSPVWLFEQYDEETASDFSTTKTPTQLIVMDATNGTIIDLLELAVSIGTYREH